MSVVWFLIGLGVGVVVTALGFVIFIVTQSFKEQNETEHHGW